MGHIDKTDSGVGLVRQVWTNNPILCGTKDALLYEELSLNYALFAFISIHRTAQDFCM